MRQAQDIALSDTYQTRAIASSEFMSSFAGNPTLVGIFEKTAAGGLNANLQLRKNHRHGM